MEAATSSPLLLSSSTRPSPCGGYRRASLMLPRLLPFNSFTKQQQHLIRLVTPRLLHIKKSSSRSSSSSPRCSSRAAGYSERWVLDPAGDGDWRHIGYKVARPGGFEIASDSVTVGRVAEKADIVLPVATVSGAHARLEKKDGALLVTDLDSTNGTYINERRLVPGFPVAVDPGSLLIFGDIHLAMFRVSKMRVEVPREDDAQKETEAEAEAEAVSAGVEEATS